MDVAVATPALAGRGRGRPKSPEDRRRSAPTREANGSPRRPRPSKACRPKPSRAADLSRSLVDRSGVELYPPSGRTVRAEGEDERRHPCTAVTPSVP